MKRYRCLLVLLSLIACFGYYIGLVIVTRNSSVPKPRDVGNAFGVNPHLHPDLLDIDIELPGRRWDGVPFKHKKIILVNWTGVAELHPNFSQEGSDVCPMCHFTDDFRYFNRSHAVILQGEFDPERLQPLRADPNQIWIWLFREPPSPLMLPDWYNMHYRELFNWTMSYHRDSDIFLPHGRFQSKEDSPASWTRLEDKWVYLTREIDRARARARNASVFERYRSVMPVPTVEDLRGRKMAAWIESRCQVRSVRHVVADELTKYGIEIDVYGDCGPLKCPTTSDLDCRTVIAPKYKFYLAFEDSFCEDYVTETLYRTLHTQMVPIIYGGANYSLLAPPGSYINVKDFANARALADYLHFLDKNPEEYLKYFEWRNHFWVQNIKFVPELCTICERIWDLSQKNSSNGPLTEDEIEMDDLLDGLTEWLSGRSDYKISEKLGCASEDEVDAFINGFIRSANVSTLAHI